jgi:hypothetical protein
VRSKIMATVTRPPDRKDAMPPAKVEDNTLDEQHAGIPEITFPVTDNDQSSESGQTHVANAAHDDRERRIATAEKEEDERDLT